jgi:hypothetical protein
MFLCSGIVWIIGVLGVLCIYIVNLVKPKFLENEKEQGKERKGRPRKRGEKRERKKNY